MKTVLYLVRHGATEANLAQPARLQGRGHNPPLAPLGISQAEATRDHLACTKITRCYSSPMLRAQQTAEIIAKPHHLTPTTLEELTECDVGKWEGMDWGSIRFLDAERYFLFMQNPAVNGYPGGESFGDVFNRVAPKLEEIVRQNEGETILVVAHHVVNRTYLASLLGYPPEKAREVKLDNCGVSVLEHDTESDCLTVRTLNATQHLTRLRAA